MDLSRALAEAHSSLRNDGSLESPSGSNLITMDAGSASVDFDEAFSPLADAFTPHADVAPSDRRVAVKLPLECYLLRAPASWPSESPPGQVAGEIRIVSGRDALVWLPEKFPTGSHLAVLIRDGELNFRAQAEVVEAASDPEGGKYWHRLAWMSLTDQATGSLSKIMETATQAKA